MSRKNPPSAKQKAEVIPWKEQAFPRLHYFSKKAMSRKNPPSEEQKAESYRGRSKHSHGCITFLKKAMSRKNPPSAKQKAEVIPWKERIPTVFEGARVKIYTALAP